MAKQEAIETEQNDLFKDVSFFLVNDQNEEVKALLTEGGATREFYVSDLVTHVVANSTDFSEYSDAKEYGLTLVTPHWVVMSSKLNQLLPQAAFSPETDQLLSGVVVCPSLIPPEDRSALWAMVTYYGGKCQLNLNSNCTHLVVPKATGAKYECALKHQDLIKIVTPSWVTDCIKNKVKLEETDYMPCREGNVNTDSILTPDSDGCTTSVSTTLTGNQGVSPAAMATPSVSTPKPAVTLPSTMMSPMSPLVTIATGSKSTTTTTTTTTLVSSDNKTGRSESSITGCKDQAGASMNKIEETPTKIAVLKEEEQELGQLDSKEGQESLNDDKENSEKVKTESTDKMETESTQKDETGKVLIKCLSGCVFVMSDYPDRVEHTVLDTWIQVIEQHGGSVSPFYSTRCTHLLCLHQRGPLFQKALEDGKRIVSAHWLNDVLTEERLFPPSNPLHLPVPFKDKLEECKDMVMCVTGYTGTQRQLLKNMIFIIGAKYTGYFSRSNTHLICKSATGEKFAKAREWGIVRVNGMWLGDTLTAGRPMSCSLVKYTVFGSPSDLDISQDFVKDILVPWQAELDALKQQAETSRKRCLEERASPENGKAIKSRRISGPATSEEKSDAPRVLFTGLPPLEVSRLTKIVTDLGGTVAMKAKRCTHLVCSKILRTVKFLSAISVCHHVASTEWLIESSKQKTFLDPKKFTVTEVTNIIQMNGVDIEQALQKARRKPLLEGKRIYVTQNVEPSSSAMREIIECAGGQVLYGVPSSGSLATFKAKERELGSPVLLVISCEKDIKFCEDFLKRGFIVYNSELLLSGVLKQELNLGMHILKRP